MARLVSTQTVLVFRASALGLSVRQRDDQAMGEPGGWLDRRIYVRACVV